MVAENLEGFPFADRICEIIHIRPGVEYNHPKIEEKYVKDTLKSLLIYCY